MAFEDVLTPTITKYLKKSSAITLFILLLILFVDSFGFFRLEQLSLGDTRFFIWAYVIVNAGIASPLYYWQERNGGEKNILKRTKQNKNHSVKK